MPRKRVRHSTRSLSPEEKTRLRDAREQIESEKDDIIQLSRKAFAMHERTIADAEHRGAQDGERLEGDTC